MKVKELICELKKMDQELPVYICDEVEGNDCGVTKIEKSFAHNMETNKCDMDVIMIRWSGEL